MISVPRLVGRSGAAVCPVDTEGTVLGSERGAQSQAEVAPCDASAAMAKS